MKIPGTPSLFFLFYLLILMPYLAIRSGRRLRQMGGAGVPAAGRSRESVWCGTIFSEFVMLALAWIVGGGFDFHIFQLPAQYGLAAVASVFTLLALLLIRAIARRFRGDEERRRMIVFLLAPRTQREWLLKIATILIASIAEEAAYRGVGMAILWYSLDNQILAAFICSVAFAVVHWVQGWKSMLVIFLFAVAMHVLAAYTGSLVGAMLVHFVYDMIAICLIWRESRRMDIGLAEAIGGAA